MKLTTTNNPEVLLDRLGIVADRYMTAPDTVDDDYSVRYAVSQIHKVLEDYDKQMGLLAKDAAGYRFSWDRLGLLVSSEASLRLWHDVIAASSPSMDDLQITVEGIQKVVADKARRLINDWDNDSSSDSMSNAITHMERAVNARFVTALASDELTISEVK